MLQDVQFPPVTADAAAVAPAAAGSPEAAGSEMLAMTVLAALTEMALRSRHGQADVEAALRRARITSEPARVAAAIDLLQQRGMVSKIIELSDGGVLLTVTGLALQRTRLRHRG
ncbi:conserved protein of unknown function [Rhodovastum atsumiense]|uniref:Uncharacterized protein n=1 Tax=Rhodovastum atsumiense TaxID=504468 RepID=A0A5M6J259_9PROT|nr:hypothetical protein [Rhodovastum atsumiense]KAA5614693.1 hypothetical protein F1189_00770 [Rhodovastum atsumiense]CAH2599774.1 conserved protein of unknown function [Rhodovastum atsumiense]